MTFTETPPNSDPGQQPSNAPLTVQGYPTATQTPPATRYYSEEELNAERARIRKEEHDKLYPQIEQHKTRAEELAAAEQARKDAEAKAAADAQRLADEEADRQRREEMSAKEALAETERKLQAQLANERAETLKAFELLRLEQQHGQLRDYRHRALAANADKILPEFHDEITGPDGDFLDSTEAIDARIQRLVEKSSSVLANMRSVEDAQRQGLPTTGQFVPPNTGPYDPSADPQVTGQGGELTLEQLRGMSAREYAQNYRHRLPTGHTGSTNRGLYD